MSDISGKVVMLRCADSKVIMREWKLIVKEWGVAGADAALARAQRLQGRPDLGRRGRRLVV